MLSLTFGGVQPLQSQLPSGFVHLHSRFIHGNHTSHNNHTREPHHTTNHVSCQSIHSYSKLLQLQQNGMHCVTLDEVIEDLYQITLADSQMTCTTALIKALRSGTHTARDICSCETSHRYFGEYSNHALHATSLHCATRHSYYRTLLTKYYSYDNPHAQNTRPCLLLSDALVYLAGINDPTCLESFIQLLGGIFHQPHHQKCHCHLQSSQTQTTAAHITTTTTKAPYQVYACNKTETIRALSRHNSIDNGNNRYQCPDGMHTKSEAVPVVLCGVPENSRWHQGKNVLRHCDSLPKYIAVASFTGGIYPDDGKAGVLISCNSTEITIITQQCDGVLKLEHIKKESHVHFTDIPQIYNTIRVSDYTHTIFG